MSLQIRYTSKSQSGLGRRRCKLKPLARVGLRQKLSQRGEVGCLDEGSKQRLSQKVYHDSASVVLHSVGAQGFPTLESCLLHVASAEHVFEELSSRCNWLVTRAALELNMISRIWICYACIGLIAHFVSPVSVQHALIYSASRGVSSILQL